MWIFSTCSKRQCVAFVSNTFNCVLSVCINCNFKTKWHSYQPISHLEFLNSLFGCLVLGCLRGRYRGTHECHKVAPPKSSVLLGRLEKLSQSHMGIDWRWAQQGKTMPFIWIMMRNGCLSLSRIRVELSRRTGRCVSAQMVQRRLVAVEYRSRRPARCPKLTHDHSRLWAHRNRNWNNQSWSHVIFANESRFSLYHCDGHAWVRWCVGERLVDCCIQEMDENVGPSFQCLGCFSCIRQIGASGGGWHGPTAMLHWHLESKFPSMGQGSFGKKLCACT